MRRTFTVSVSVLLTALATATPAFAQDADAGAPVADAAAAAPTTALDTKTPAPTKVEEAKPDDAKKDEPKKEELPSGRFEFGAYGRVRIASDLRGGTGRTANIVAYGTRIDEDSYAEIELRREDTWKKDIRTRVVTTLAFFPQFFHFTGNATQQIAMRNLYVQGTYGPATLWVGSRMYRGDDIYLLNWWPLDNQNTVGGGAGLKLPKDTMVAFHMGMQRLDNAYQTQVIQAVAPSGFGVVDVLKVDRPRIIETLKLTHFLRNSDGRQVFQGNDKMGFKFIVYGEAHQLAAGTQRDPLTGKDRALPEDSGWLLGAQIGYWTGERDSFAHLFFRHARGIAVYDPLAVPQTFANDRTVSGASETLVALAGNYETGMLGLQWGGYLRFFRDGSDAPLSKDKFDEGSLVLRPNFFIGEHFGVAVEGSYQMRRYALSDANGEGVKQGGLTRFGIMPFFSPSGRGSFKRPQLRVLYVLTARDGGARSLYAPEDVFSQRKVEHFLGLSAEWWFNSSSYP